MWRTPHKITCGKVVDTWEKESCETKGGDGSLECDSGARMIGLCTSDDEKSCGGYTTQIKCCDITYDKDEAFVNLTLIIVPIIVVLLTGICAFINRQREQETNQRNKVYIVNRMTLT
eukprot:UN27241